MSEKITLTVNGEIHTTSVPARTQLAEILRDRLELTGTHVGCEQGVCGACTVMMNGRPVRSCITFANNCDGADIVTIEGFENDPFMNKITDAFSRHHALQCGFCTPGMLATAKDILLRFPSPSEEQVRHELSGNLCRCTGYQGIVRAILDVGEQIMEKDIDTTTTYERGSTPLQFKPFDPIDEIIEAESVQFESSGEVTQDGSWTVVNRSFSLNHSTDDVWDLFSDVSRVASCVPGASIGDVSNDTFSGVVEIAFGPIKARFGGEGTYDNNNTDRKGHISGAGSDKNGQSRVKGELHYDVQSGSSDASSIVDVQFRFEIQGLLVQFNRPELVTGFVDFLLERFVTNCNTVLSGGTADGSHKISAMDLILTLAKSFLKRFRN